MNKLKRLLTISAALPLLLAFFALNLSQVQAQYKVGDDVQDFSVKSISGADVSLADYADQQGVILVITCNHCPYSKLYEDRIIDLHNEFAGKGYPVLAISSNDAEQYPSDSYKMMKKRAKKKAFPFDYCYDEPQDVARAFGATRTPEVFVLQNDEGAFVIKYHGAIDDNAKTASEVKTRYVEDAVNALLQDKRVEPAETKAIGCGIKWKES